MKILVVTGGVLSGLGKGVAGASIGFLLGQNKKIVPIKLDGYLNSDPGTMNPVEHGEVFVLEDGTEVDMDFGHYERFLNHQATKDQNITMGKIFYEIWQKERRGDYLGKTVQLIPHVTDLIKEKIMNLGKKLDADILLLEVGGTIGDIENELFVEAIKQIKQEVPKQDILFVHLTYVPIPYGVNEQKTKPTQQSVKLLMEKGIFPDFILARSQKYLTEQAKQKISLFSNIDKEDIISAMDMDNIYKIPLVFDEQNLGEKVSEKFNIEYLKNPRLEKLKELVSREIDREIQITIAGKYTNLEDSYASIIEALKHCEMNLKSRINISWLDTSEEIDFELLKKSDGIIVPGGFGKRGVEGKIEVIKFARENNIPFLGICYGLQLAVIEFARNICNLRDAHSTEIDPLTTNPLVSLLDEQKNVVNKGGTMRLGSYNAQLKDSVIKEIYKETGNFELQKEKFIVKERHRHRYEVNPMFHEILENNGLKIVGKSPDRILAEFIEIPGKKYFVATQGHPELKSQPDNPAPLFYGLIKAALNK